MSKANTKKILISKELKSSEEGVFFESLGITLEENFNKDSDYLFVVNDYLPEVRNLPRLHTKNMFFSEAYLDNQITACIVAGKNELKDAKAKELLKDYFSEEVRFDLIEKHSKKLQSISSIKIQDYLNIGFFVDAVIVEAYKNNFEINKVREFLNHLLLFSFSRLELGNRQAPVDLSYSCSDDAFVVQASIELDRFEGKDELVKDDYLERLFNKTNFLDVSYFKKKKRLTIASLWFKAPELQNFKSYFFTEIASRSAVAPQVGEVDVRVEAFTKEKVVYQSKEKSDALDSRALVMARKFSLFITNFRNIEDNPKALESLTIEDINHYLDQYPKKKAVSEVDDEIKDIILKLVKDESINKEITEEVTRISNSNLDPQIDDIKRVLSNKSLEDIEEVIMINGVGEDLGDDVLKVKGFLADEDQSETRIKGVTEDLSNNEKWEIKKNKINEAIQNEVVTIKGTGRSVVQDDIIRIVAKELGADEKDIKSVVKGIVEEVVSKEIISTSKAVSSLPHLYASKEIKSANEEKLEAQMSRMKKVMEQMKREMIKLANKTETSVLSKDVNVVSEDESAKQLKLEQALHKAMGALKNKEKILEKNRADFEAIIKEKERKIQQVEQKIDEMKLEHALSKEFANQEKLQSLESENKTLQSRLDLANKKVNIINENIEHRENEDLSKSERESTRLKANLQAAQEIIERFKKDKLEMEARISAEIDNSRKMKEAYEAKLGSLGGSSGQNVEETMAKLDAAKKDIEEKYRLQGIELKRLEQKLKYQTSQLEASNKKKDAKGSDVVIKQLEKAKSTVNEMTADLTEKKKEAIKLKQENAQLQARITELEKKLSNAEKKAA